MSMLGGLSVVGIGFFAPFPLALMIPFMAGQSLAMGEAFGKGFQYGKRKISSMNNEEFNALNFKQLSESIATDYKVMIPSMKKSLEASDELQRAVFDALGKIILTLPDAVAGMFSDSTNRAGLTPAAEDSVTTTAFSEIPSTITQVRAGSGLGDIRKQQERSIEQTAAEIESKERKDKLRLGAQARFENRSVPTVTASLGKKVLSPAAARSAQRKMLKDTITQIRRNINGHKNEIKKYQSLIQTGKSTERALSKLTQMSGTRGRNATKQIEGIRRNRVEWNRRLAVATQNLQNQNKLLRKTQDFLTGLGSF